MTARHTNARKLGALATVAAAAALVVPATAAAAVTGTVAGNTATLTGDAAADTIIISSEGGLLRHNLAGFNSATDFDSTAAGDQTLTTAATLTINGGAGDDIIVGGPNADVLNGDDGNDRITGFTGNDDVNGGNGNDLMQWNNGDGTDTNDGDAGADETLITGRNTTDDMTVANGAPGRVVFNRAAPGAFAVDMGTVERLHLTPFQGDDKLVTQPDVTLPITVEAGPGIDAITTGAGGDLVQGGEDVDTLNAGPGNDRVLGNPGNDIMNGNAGDDTLVWFNGDGTDDMNGEDGLDRIETNLGAADDVSQLKVENGLVRYDRINAPFGLNVATSEVFELNTFDGADTLDVAPGVGGLIAVTVDGGAGNDRFNGGDEADTFLGGLGDDILEPGTGSDTADGQGGDDTLKLRDGVGDLAVGGTGTDSAIVDSLDAVAADVENVDRSKSGAKALKIYKKVKLDRRYRAHVKIACDDSAIEGCKGRLYLLAKANIGGKKLEVLLAKARYDLSAGETEKVDVRIPKYAKRLIKKGKLKLKAQAVARNAAGDYTVVSKYVTLEAPKKR
ncbi:MAG TPA: calcium-binding protein [Solirubrobacteraceae bacterium]|nr:calcium-binding protein [Solirubrobacteraceae bacterium]